MKNVLYKIGIGLCGVLCVCLLSATTALAVDSEETPIYCTGAFEVGDTAKYYCYNKMVSGGYTKTEINYTVTDEDLYMCFYLSSNSVSSSGYGFDKMDVPSAIYSQYDENSELISSYGNYNVIGVAPVEYSNPNKIDSTVMFYTNIPIFETLEIAQQYNSGDVSVLPQAINYNLSWANGSWVRPFEDIEINDSNIPTPTLSNVSHNGFTVTNAPSEQYMVDVYLESGIQNPLPYEKNLTSIGDALFVNSFGLVSDVEGAYTGEIDLLACYGIDNLTALNESKNSFYSTYPSLSAFNSSLPISILGKNSKTFSIWGSPFGRYFVFWGDNTSPTSIEITNLSINNMPLCFTNYKVRYYYYDESSGFHYGPWTNFLYFSDGRVFENSIYQDNSGNVIETPLQSGQQDSSGNVTVNTMGNLIDIENPNELFGYIRSIVNNIDATMGSFSTLFATIFTFIPGEIQTLIWLGIAVMVVIGVVKVVKS